MLTLDYGQLAGLLGVGFAFAAAVALAAFMLGVVAETMAERRGAKAKDGEQESEAQA